ncbi:pyruvate dehydrogenase E2 component (dihydrolipoamide acetyltransferase) [Halorubrum aquaticum]|uniref:Pyruvate dehydrogenase E2 component (Dihydrolipoamide acetyltransferase) n=1 Tax=Halorubrum aquaticum TaxID=387340 RepID=A0A1I3CFU1_9EURY|nr:2-oxo acid dehydrogenase subunit E2 [Halorubrum aquaticum]SFH73444.1 pyruvate dehydrogenase E2 component (dihydrolipoamide acetyltransferase) [Halorubrum aquaticum]
MTIEEFRLPDVGEGVAEGELVSWLVAPGDRVEEDQPVAEVETDKALVEVPSSYDGIVEELFVEEGDVVPVGDVLISFRVDEAGEESADTGSADGEPTDAGSVGAGSADAEPTSVEAEPDTSSGRTFAPPSVRRLARELGVDLGAVEGSGSGGRVSERDVREHADSGDSGDSGADEADAPAPKPVDVGSGDRKSAVSKRGSVEETDATTMAESGAGPDPADRERTLATPATRKLARELGVDVDEVPTDETREGEAFVDEERVRAYVETVEAGTSPELDASPEPDATVTGGVESEPAPADPSVDAPTSTAATVSTDADDAAADVAPDTVAAGDEADAPGETIPYRGVRRTIGQRMEESKFTAPHVTHHDTAEVDALVAARDRLKPKAAEEGVSLTYLPFVMKAVLAGLREYPILNSELREENEEIVLKDEYHFGVAVATDAGLMVPVVEDVDEKGLFELAAEVTDLAARARDRSLTPAELRGGTFTLTNFGAIGGEYATPIINYPETAILGLGAIERRPVVRERSAIDDEFFGDDEEGYEVVPAPTLPLSLSIDHRVVDGAVAARFANTVMDHLEDPLLLLNE